MHSLFIFVLSFGISVSAWAQSEASCQEKSDILKDEVVLRSDIYMLSLKKNILVHLPPHLQEEYKHEMTMMRSAQDAEIRQLWEGQVANTLRTAFETVLAPELKKLQKWGATNGIKISVGEKGSLIFDYRLMEDGPRKLKIYRKIVITAVDRRLGQISWKTEGSLATDYFADAEYFGMFVDDCESQDCVRQLKSAIPEEVFEDLKAANSN